MPLYFRYAAAAIRQYHQFDIAAIVVLRHAMLPFFY